jgi:hypothetical protein
MLTTFFRLRRLGRVSAVALLAVLCAVLASGDASAAGGGTLHLRCANETSGASFQIVVDLDQNRVDSEPATVTDKMITWADPKQGYFDLDRTTWKLVFRNASSTGGYFLHYACKPE